MKLDQPTLAHVAAHFEKQARAWEAQAQKERLLGAQSQAVDTARRYREVTAEVRGLGEGGAE